jgi:cytochrome c553
MQLVTLAHRASTLLLISLLAACQAATADTPPPEPPPAKRFEHGMTLRFHMHQSYDLVRAIERLLIRGKLDEAKRFAEAIAMTPEAPAHGPWAALTATVRDRAMAVARATSVDDALRKETQLAAACADCHREHHGSAMFEKPPAAPPDRPTLDARMARHRWAADRLWEAVVGDADAPWQGGLDVLATAPLELDAERAPFARELQRLATAARRAKRPAVNRARTYGEILVTCAGCHAKTK